MKYLRQFSWIMAVTCVGELLKYFLPLPIPASVYGLCIMLLLLVCKVIKVENVEETGGFSDRNHATYVYTGNGRTDCGVATATKHSDTGSHYNGHFNDMCNDCIRESDAAHYW